MSFSPAIATHARPRGARARATTYVLYAAIALGGVLRIQSAFAHNPADALFSDPERHWRQAAETVQAGPFTAIDPIGYQIWLGAIAQLTLGDPRAIAAYAALLSLVTPWLWYRFAREALYRKEHALLLFAALALLPSWITIFSYFMNETLLLPLLGAALWATWRALRAGSYAGVAVATVLWMAASMTRVIALPAAVLCLLALVRYGPQRWRRLGLTIGIAALMTIPVAYRAYLLIKVPSPFGYIPIHQVYWESGAAAIDAHLRKERGAATWIYHFESPSIGDRPFAPFSDWHTARAGTVEIWVDLDRGAADWNHALAAHWPAWRDAGRYWLENIIFLGFGNSWPDSDPEIALQRAGRGMRWVWAPLLLLVMITSARYVGRHRAVPLLLAITLGLWMISLFAPSAVLDGRYRKPLEGLTLASALWLWDRSRPGLLAHPIA